MIEIRIEFAILSKTDYGVGERRREREWGKGGNEDGEKNGTLHTVDNRCATYV